MKVFDAIGLEPQWNITGRLGQSASNSMLAVGGLDQ